MKNIIASFVILVTVSLFPQTAKVDIPLTITDGAGGIQILRFGLDSMATDGVDINLGEAPLPPLPPSGIFDARFNLLDGTDASLRDYRKDTISNNEQTIHEIQFQVGSGSAITISWNFVSGIKGRLQDVVLGTIIDVPMQDSGGYTVTNPSAFNKLKMTITYTDVLPVESISFSAKKVSGYRLNQNYPNPFNPSTTINYQISNQGFVTLKVYDILGNEIQTLVSEVKSEGTYDVTFNSANMPSGVYFYKLQSGSFIETKKMILLR
ncbi:MAG: T9SS type A sorting domain-containing protein [Ignavibacteriaceae bacterium]|nr:T9SS type A sorting domain-containing protein [Ignavibacteriaceae bacterium]